MGDGPANGQQPHPRRRVSESRTVANRRKARRSTTPLEEKARVAENAVKLGFFADPEQWCPEDRRALEEILAGLREEFRPESATEEQCIVEIGTAHVQFAMLMRYEGIAARDRHLREEQELNDRIANADSAEAARLERGREQLKSAGLWGPTLPDARTGNAILRLEGRVNRSFYRAFDTLEKLRMARQSH